MPHDGRFSWWICIIFYVLVSALLRKFENKNCPRSNRIKTIKICDARASTGFIPVNWIYSYLAPRIEDRRQVVFRRETMAEGKKKGRGHGRRGKGSVTFPSSSIFAPDMKSISDPLASCVTVIPLLTGNDSASDSVAGSVAANFPSPSPLAVVAAAPSSSELSASETSVAAVNDWTKNIRKPTDALPLGASAKDGEADLVIVSGTVPSREDMPLVLTSSARRGVYECDYCRTDISQIPRVRCAVCPDFDLCLDCFSTTDPSAAGTVRAASAAFAKLEEADGGPCSKVAADANGSFSMPGGGGKEAD